MSIANSFNHFAKWTSRTAGHPSTFGVAVGIVLIWAVTGPLFGFSDSWQLVINTGTTIVTFLMVSSSRTRKTVMPPRCRSSWDELIRALQGAHNELVDLEDLGEEELERMKAHYTQLAERARTKLQKRPRNSKGEDQAETGKSQGSGKAATKASTA